jgi:hypothetical protein
MKRKVADVGLELARINRRLEACQLALEMMDRRLKAVDGRLKTRRARGAADEGRQADSTLKTE